MAETRKTKVVDPRKMKGLACCYNCARWKVDRIKNNTNWCTELNMYTHPTCGCYAYEESKADD